MTLTSKVFSERHKYCRVNWKNLMIGGTAMVTVDSLFSQLSDENKMAVNSFIEFLYYTSKSKDTKEAINDALTGNTVGPFETIEDFMKDLYEED